MFVDELTINAFAGRGGNGVVRWLRERHRPLGGPAGGDGGRGGDVYVRTVRDLGLLSKYVGVKEFRAENGGHGGGKSLHGRAGEDCIIDVPLGSTVTVALSGEVYECMNAGEQIRVLRGGNGGYGNEHFKSSINRSPEETTSGKNGEKSALYIELSLGVDVGFMGFPNAGKSTLLNALTNASSRVGDYPFTTLEPHLGDFYGYIIADIPGLIEGAAKGLGLGHKFLRHIRRAKILVHLVSFENEDMLSAYRAVRSELDAFDSELTKKREFVLLTKRDLVDEELAQKTVADFKVAGVECVTVSMYDDGDIKNVGDRLTAILREE